MNNKERNEKTEGVSCELTPEERKSKINNIINKLKEISAGIQKDENINFNPFDTVSNAKTQ